MEFITTEKFAMLTTAFILLFLFSLIFSIIRDNRTTAILRIVFAILTIIFGILAGNVIYAGFATFMTLGQYLYIAFKDFDEKSKAEVDVKTDAEAEVEKATTIIS